MGTIKKGDRQMKDDSKQGDATFNEIRSQADSWDGTMARVDRISDRLKKLIQGVEEVVFAGCGSALNVSFAVSPYFQEILGLTCRAVHSSDLVLNPDMFINSKRSTLAIVYSRSGSTTESAMAVRKAKDRGCRTLAIVCFADSPMAREADEAIVLEEAVEKSVTTTRSLTSMVLAGNYLAAVCRDNRPLCESYKTLPGKAREMMSRFEEEGKKLSENPNLKKYAFLGSGTYYGLAREAQLKIKEMVLLPSDSYISLDYQHGPMSNVDSGMLVTILVSDAGRDYDLSLAGKMKELGGTVLVICDKGGAGFSGKADFLVELDTGLGDGVRNILYMPVLQFMAAYKSLATGNDPDNPKNLFYYVKVEEK
jgi:glutamine---fructose-6-phosphate transaminase (isomerizing)